MSAEIVEKITRAYELDQQRNVIAREASDLPLSFEAITREWLTNVLCKSVPGAEVVSFELGAPDVGSSNRRKIAVSYNAAGTAAGLPKKIFCKASQDLANRIVLGISGGAICEVAFYRDIRNLLNIEAPHSFYAHFNPDTYNSMVILADISDDVTEFCNDKTQMPRKRAESQIHLLAEMHGRIYGSPKLQQLIKQFTTWPEYFEKTLSFGMKDGSSKGFLAAEEVIPSRLYKRYDEIWPATMASIALHENVPHTLAHGDVHLKNWYVAGNGEMGLGDWQCCGRGMWARDFAYAIASALTPENRRAWERELLQMYLEEMQAAGGPKVSFDEGWLAYRQQLVTALTWWTVTLTPPEGLPDMQPRDTTLEFIRRIATAMDDVDSLDAFK